MRRSSVDLSPAVQLFRRLVKTMVPRRGGTGYVPQGYGSPPGTQPTIRWPLPQSATRLPSFLFLRARPEKVVLTSSSTLGSGFSTAAGRLPRWVPASPRCADIAAGLTLAPQAFSLSARPAARIFLAALWSRSWTEPHPQVHARTFSGFLSPTVPHVEHILVDGNHRSIRWNVRP